MSDTISLPKEFWEEDVGVPRRPCSCLANMFEGWFCCDTAADSRDCDSDWERELSGEVESDDEELKEDDRAREPGMFTGADPPSTLWPVETSLHFYNNLRENYEEAICDQTTESTWTNQVSLLASPTLLSCSSNSLSRDATLMSLKLRSRADPVGKRNIPGWHLATKYIRASVGLTVRLTYNTHTYDRLHCVAPWVERGGFCIHCW